MPESNEAAKILARAEHLAMLILNDGEIFESFLSSFIDRIGTHWVGVRMATGLPAGELVLRREFVVLSLGPVIDRAIRVLSGRPYLSPYDRGALRADRLHVAELMVEHYADRLGLIEIKS